MKAVSISAVARSDTASIHAARHTLASHRMGSVLLGLAIASLLPAFFWMAVVQVVGSMFGMTIGAFTLVSIGAAIAVFLSIICGAVILRG